MSMALSPQRKATHPGGPADPPRGGRETILVVDDEKLITKSTARLLKRHGYSTLTAFNGREALAGYEHCRDGVDLVLLDMDMPEMDGTECLAGLKQLDPEVRVIVLSGHAPSPQATDPVKQGAMAFIQKPCDSEVLLATVRSVLDDPAPPRRRS